MSRVTALQAKTRLGELLDRVAQGEEVIITRHDKPVARLVPEGRLSLEQTRKAAAGLRALQSAIKARSSKASSLSWREVKAAISEGRK